jgi:hypothetical protein
MELYPGWSARDNYGYGSKKKKRKKDRSPADTGGITHCFVLFIPSLLFSLTKPRERNDRIERFPCFNLGAFLQKSFDGFFLLFIGFCYHLSLNKFWRKMMKNFSSWMHQRCESFALKKALDWLLLRLVCIQKRKSGNSAFFDH